MNTDSSISRRKFLIYSGAATVMATGVSKVLAADTPAVTTTTTTTAATITSPFTVGAFTISLPYAETALEPTISAKTIGLHYGKHHSGYVKTLNDLVKGHKYENMSLERIIRLTYNQLSTTPVSLPKIYNNAAQIWNHSFYWKSLTPAGGDATLKPGKLSGLINRDFPAGGLTDLKTQLLAAAAAHFGSGWAWLVYTQEGKLKVVSTKNADSPLQTMGATPLLVLDVWEHAYYVDYANVRATYLQSVVDKLVNWQFAEDNLPV
jgi:Fe-Mn family superoxide dismutase